MSAAPPQTPLFRPELMAMPEQEGGVDYVRIHDPASGRTTRLYALEYEVARAMDGRRSLSEVAAAVSAAQGVTPSLSDLAAFVTHLAAHGLVVEGSPSHELGRPPFWGEGPQGPSPLGETATLEAPLLRDTGPGASPPVPPPNDTFATQDAYSPVMTRPTVVLGTQERQSRAIDEPTPTHHVLEGSDTNLSPHDSVHAGVYAMVTEELDLHESGGAEPPRPATGSETPTEPDPPGQSSINVRVQASQRRRPPPLWRRLMPPWLLAMLAFGAVALGVLWRTGKIGGPTEPEVVVRTVHPTLRPRVAPQAAMEIQPARQIYLPAPSDGTLGSIADANTLVSAGDIVAALRMPDEEADNLEAAREELNQANGRLKELGDERARLAQRRKDLQAQQLAVQGETRRRAQRTIARQLVQIDRRDRVLRETLVDARSQHARAAVGLGGLEKKLASYLVRAPFSGVIGSARVAIGVNLRAGQPLVALEDRQQITLTFSVPPGQSPKVGEKIAVLVGGPGGSGQQLPATVDELLPAPRGPNQQPRLRVALVDERGALSTKPPHAFHIVTGQAAHALWVPAAALGPAIEKSHAVASVWLSEHGRAQQLGVEVLEKREDGAWVVPAHDVHEEALELIVASSAGMMALVHNQPLRVVPEAPQAPASPGPDASHKENAAP